MWQNACKYGIHSKWLKKNFDLLQCDYMYVVGWFQGLSQQFLSSSVPKMLLLAGVDRLDKDLTVGQMQGKVLE